MWDNSRFICLENKNIDFIYYSYFHIPICITSLEVFYFDKINSENVAFVYLCFIDHCLQKCIAETFMHTFFLKFNKTENNYF